MKYDIAQEKIHKIRMGGLVMLDKDTTSFHCDVTFFCLQLNKSYYVIVIILMYSYEN